MKMKTSFATFDGGKYLYVSPSDSVFTFKNRNKLETESVLWFWNKICSKWQWCENGSETCIGSFRGISVD